MPKKEICKEKENKRQNENTPNYKREGDISLNSKNEEKSKKGKKIRHQPDLKNKEGSNLGNKDKNQIKETKIKFNNCSVNTESKIENENFLDDINNNIERNKMNNLKIKKLNKSIKEKYPISNFDSKLKGFAHTDSILTGVETRTSSPVRILRNDNLVSNIDGLYPCGEGAGYAGGIMTAAIDGIKCAIKIIERKD